ncbi:hypothetical protein [Pseudomonas sp. GV071]|uniref:hypothetical protein n=1 Tax=Pseudomonas sp. GV071 TaxID=2135754 RepID=UPI000D34F0D2|nr:hypothetical protein [Pseudomonas sp. GV071]PTQ70394.1 hypothetical protein C8K61_106116 [Pseudomonas sp. GV071]
MNSTFPNVMDCPHCKRDEFNDEDDWFEHVSCCQWEQEQAEVGVERVVTHGLMTREEAEAKYVLPTKAGE